MSDRNSPRVVRGQGRGPRAPRPGDRFLPALILSTLTAFTLLLLSPGPAIATPEIAFVETECDLGEVAQGSVTSYTFSFVNTGDTPLEILEVESPCDCTVPHLSHERIEPGERAELVVTFDSERLAGETTKEIFVRSNDPLQPEVTLTLYAHVLPGLTVEPPTVNLGEIPLEGGVSRTIRLTASDEMPFQVTELRAGLPFISARVVEPPGGEPSPRVTVEVTAASGGPPGPFVDFLVMTTTHPLRETVEVPLRGEVESLFRLEPARLSFGTAKAEGQRLGEVTITYTGPQEVNLLEATSSAPSLRVELKPYEAGEGGRVSVYLTEEVKVGRISETVTVTTDLPEQPTLSIRVVGYVRK